MYMSLNRMASDLAGTISDVVAASATLTVHHNQTFKVLQMNALLENFNPYRMYIMYNINLTIKVVLSYHPL